MTNNYVTISHHGIVGMKWGLRRYQNPDGSLTPEGKIRYAKVAGSKILSRMDANDAKTTLSRDIRKNYKYAQVAEHRNDAKRAKQFIKKATASERYLSDINSGKVKAGRDFIVQRDYNVYPFALLLSGRIVPTAVVSVEKRLIKRSK